MDASVVYPPRCECLVYADAVLIRFISSPRCMIIRYAPVAASSPGHPPQGRERSQDQRRNTTATITSTNEPAVAAAAAGEETSNRTHKEAANPTTSSSTAGAAAATATYEAECYCASCFAPTAAAPETTAAPPRTTAATDATAATTIRFRATVGDYYMPSHGHSSSGGAAAGGGGGAGAGAAAAAASSSSSASSSCPRGSPPATYAASMHMMPPYWSPTAAIATTMSATAAGIPSATGAAHRDTSEASHVLIGSPASSASAPSSSASSSYSSSLPPPLLLQQQQQQQTPHMHTTDQQQRREQQQQQPTEHVPQRSHHYHRYHHYHHHHDDHHHPQQHYNYQSVVEEQQRQQQQQQQQQQQEQRQQQQPEQRQQQQQEQRQQQQQEQRQQQQQEQRQQQQQEQRQQQQQQLHYDYYGDGTKGEQPKYAERQGEQRNDYQHRKVTEQQQQQEEEEELQQQYPVGKEQQRIPCYGIFGVTQLFNSVYIICVEHCRLVGYIGAAPVLHISAFHLIQVPRPPPPSGSSSSSTSSPSHGVGVPLPFLRTNTSPCSPATGRTVVGTTKSPTTAPDRTAVRKEDENINAGWHTRLLRRRRLLQSPGDFLVGATVSVSSRAAAALAVAAAPTARPAAKHAAAAAAATQDNTNTTTTAEHQSPPTSLISSHQSVNAAPTATSSSSSSSSFSPLPPSPPPPDAAQQSSAAAATITPPPSPSAPSPAPPFPCDSCTDRSPTELRATAITAPQSPVPVSISPSYATHHTSSTTPIVTKGMTRAGFFAGNTAAAAAKTSAYDSHTPSRGAPSDLSTNETVAVAPVSPVAGAAALSSTAAAAPAAALSAAAATPLTSLFHAKHTSLSSSSPSPSSTTTTTTPTTTLCGKTTFAEDTAAQQAAEEARALRTAEEWLGLLCDGLCEGAFYFSPLMDMTQSMQRQLTRLSPTICNYKNINSHNSNPQNSFSKTRNINNSNSSNSNSSNSGSSVKVDRWSDRFCCNRYFMEPLLRQTPEAQAFSLRVIQGFIGMEMLSYSLEACNILCIISRRDVSRTGARFHSRGLNAAGDVSNMVETEQLLLVHTFRGACPPTPLLLPAAHTSDTFRRPPPPQSANLSTHQHHNNPPASSLLPHAPHPPPPPPPPPQLLPPLSSSSSQQHQYFQQQQRHSQQPHSHSPMMSSAKPPVPNTSSYNVLQDQKAQQPLIWHKKFSQASESSGLTLRSAAMRLRPENIERLDIYSFVQLRGSIPLLWQQTPTLRWVPSPVVIGEWNESLGPATKHFDALTHASSRHDLMHVVCDACLVNRGYDKERTSTTTRTHRGKCRVCKRVYVDTNTFLRVLGNYYQKVLQEQGRQDSFIWFDFHRHCGQGAWHNLSLLVESVQKQLQQQHYFHAVCTQPLSAAATTSLTFMPPAFCTSSLSSPHDHYTETQGALRRSVVWRRGGLRSGSPGIYFHGGLPGWQSTEVRGVQTGVFRVNCIDCLDRTNVVESLFAKYVLSRILVSRCLKGAFLPLLFLQEGEQDDEEEGERQQQQKKRQQEEELLQQPENLKSAPPGSLVDGGRVPSPAQLSPPSDASTPIAATATVKRESVMKDQQQSHHQLQDQQTQTQRHHEREQEKQQAPAREEEWKTLVSAGTRALKTEFTRTGVRSTRGVLNDMWNSINRYFLNNFFDGYKQDYLTFFFSEAAPCFPAPLLVSKATPEVPPSHVFLLPLSRFSRSQRPKNGEAPKPFSAGLRRVLIEGVLLLLLVACTLPIAPVLLRAGYVAGYTATASGLRLFFLPLTHISQPFMLAHDVLSPFTGGPSQSGTDHTGNNGFIDNWHAPFEIVKIIGGVFSVIGLAVLCLAIYVFLRAAAAVSLPQLVLLAPPTPAEALAAFTRQALLSRAAEEGGKTDSRATETRSIKCRTGRGKGEPSETAIRRHIPSEPVQVC